jgi:hypothetical protein
MVSRISSAVLVHTNGRGLSFQVSTQAWIACLSWATQRWVPRRSHLVVSSAQPPLDQVQPRAGGRGEVQLNAGMGTQPPLDRGSLVGRGVVADHVDGEVGRDGLVDPGQEAAELDRAGSRGQLGDDVARRDVQGRVQVGGAVAGVVVRARLTGPGQQRQHRRSPIQRLHLGVLVHAPHQGGLGRVQVQPDHACGPCRCTAGRWTA